MLTLATILLLILALITAADGLGQEQGKVMIDLQTGDIWGSPRNRSSGTGAQGAAEKSQADLSGLCDDFRRTRRQRPFGKKCETGTDGPARNSDAQPTGDSSHNESRGDRARN